MEVRVESAHVLRLVTHLILPHIFLCSLAPQPRISEPANRVPAHPVLIETHCHEARREPTVFEVVVEVWCASFCAEEQTALPRREASQNHQQVLENAPIGHAEYRNWICPVTTHQELPL